MTDRTPLSAHDDAGESRLEDLLLGRFTSGLTLDEDRELDAMLDHDEAGAAAFELEDAAAIASVALIEDRLTPMPTDLRETLLAAAPRVLRESTVPGSGGRALGGRTAGGRVQGGGSSPGASASSSSLVAFLTLLVLAAIVFGSWGWWQLLQVEPETPPPTPAEVRETILAAADVVRLPWKGLEEPGFENVTGEVVWSDELQSGFMRLSNLPANDPAREQYQLWIVDPARDKHPVDGGVFDVGAGESLVAIDAKLDVKNPAAFVLTLEQPGGVVVSDGPHLVLAAR